MIKVLYLLNHAGSGGTERYIKILVEYLDKKRIKAYFAYNEEGKLVEDLKSLGVELYRVPLANRFDIAAASRIAWLCRKLGIDIIHTQFLRENYIAVLSRLFNQHSRVIYTNHIILYNDLFTCMTNRLFTPFDASITAVCGKGLEAMIKSGVRCKRMNVIHNAVNPAQWKITGRSSVRSEFGLDDSEFVIICVARFTGEKGHSFLIRAFAELKRIYGARFKCILAGDGPLLEDTRRLARESDLTDELIFTGYRNDIKNLLHGSNLFICPSKNEALSYAILEALAAGLPVVASNVGGTPDIINNETGCGILVDYGEEMKLADAVFRMMNDQEFYETCKRNALKAIESKFNLAKMADETYNLYKVCKKG